MSRAAILSLLVLAAACDNPTGAPRVPDDTKDLQTLVTRAFSVSAPSNWQFRELQGIDSYVGELSGDGATLRFDYGWYSDPLPESEYPAHTMTYEIIDGKQAKIVVPNVTGQGWTGVHFPSLGGKTKLTMTGHNLTVSQQETALAIFRSIRFTK